MNFPKIFILALGISMTANFCLAQDNSSYLFGNRQAIGFYISPLVQAGPVASEMAGFATFKGALVFNRRFSVGGMYSFTFNEFTPAIETETDSYLDLRLGGLFLEYTLQPSRLLHFTFPLALGAGEIQNDWKDNSINYNNEDTFGEDNFFFIEPGAMLEINLLPFMKLNGGVTYRLIPGGVDYRGLEASDISGLTGVLGLKLGIFRER